MTSVIAIPYALLLFAADGRHLGYPRHGEQSAANDPVGDCANLDR